MKSLDRRVPIPAFHVSSVAMFSSWWWNDVLAYLTGLSCPRLRYETGSWVLWGTPGWAHDLYTFYHRGRYGWAPRDTWSLDYYLSGVFAGSLTHLNETRWGSPGFVYQDVMRELGLGNPETWDTSMLPHDEQKQVEDAAEERWSSMLDGWARAFAEHPEDTDYDDRRENIRRTLVEMSDKWDTLWT